jgi:hypothetical protein
MVKKYERRWPNCDNLSCFPSSDLEDVKAACLSQEACDGFSISAMAMDGGKGDGCFKTKCNADHLDAYTFGSRQDGYWAKVSTSQLKKEDDEARKENFLDALIQKKFKAEAPTI